MSLWLTGFSAITTNDFITFNKVLCKTVLQVILVFRITCNIIADTQIPTPLTLKYVFSNFYLFIFLLWFYSFLFLFKATKSHMWPRSLSFQTPEPDLRLYSVQFLFYFERLGPGSFFFLSFLQWRLWSIS